MSKISLTPVEDSPVFPKAVLKLKSPAPNSKHDINVVRFVYDIKNYELATQTSDAKQKHCNNSDKGQHIHLILNNEPYLARYETDFSETLKEGTYVALSFLSRSYHESLKHKNAYDIRQFTVGTGTYEKVDLTRPMLFYSRPKGEYIGKDTTNILLDFYLVNVKLSENGYKVRATIDGQEFIITSWKAYFIKGLTKGEHSIKIELLDKHGKPVSSPFCRAERKIVLK
ncbi:MAG: hypothetical protein NZ529_09740 [Cytophagaceae bacterium]|nr:hypothetical protein [Cytophagaceae bacterium]MDW8457068.1 hypothetical protein [Cytophagaceae bacterium]